MVQLAKERVSLMTFGILSRWSTLALLFTSGAFAAPAAPGRTPAGEVVSINGVVFVREDGAASASAIRHVKAGDVLFAGDVVNTSSTGSAKLLLKDKTVVDLGPSALLKLNRFAANGGSDREVDVSMAYGSIRAAVSQKLQGRGKIFVRTSVTTMGVRGTEFVVDSTPPSGSDLDRAILNLKHKDLVPPSAAGASAGTRTSITVLQGEVEARQRLADQKQAASQAVSLRAGKQLVAREGDKAPAASVALSPQQLAAISSQARFKDKTFLKAVAFDSVEGAGEATKKLIASAMAGAALPDVPLEAMGFGGVFGPVDATRAPTFNPYVGIQKYPPPR